MVSLSARENWQAWSTLLQRANYFASTYSILVMSGKLLTFVLCYSSTEASGDFCIVLWPLQCVLRAAVAEGSTDLVAFAGANDSWYLAPLVLMASWGSRSEAGKDCVCPQCIVGCCSVLPCLQPASSK